MSSLYLPALINFAAKVVYFFRDLGNAGLNPEVFFAVATAFHK